MNTTQKKYTDLAICLIMDILGMSTYSIPLIGEVGDLFWAPFSATVFFFLFKRKFGLIGGAFNFLEEILPGSDVIPTFTLAWVGKYLIGKQQEEPDEGLKKIE
ncbi:hypothetical protein [Solitalea lacus]|uniref:hypothetical protein n=1 Tax=Solitalea lacus TaxID=2911172 RepID=UPI001EDA3E75|nr:hypothetical protein [Solitalea lacus]UKJ07853.1 hypothetical protein L2B55_01500 [Solitalea lacus]